MYNVILQTDCLLLFKKNPEKKEIYKIKTYFSYHTCFCNYRYHLYLNRFAPGNIWTPMWDNLSKETSDPEKCVKDGKDAQVKD